MVGTDNNSLSTGRPLSMSTVGAKPRPFVQAYNPDPSPQQPQPQQQYHYDNHDPMNYNNQGYDLDPSQTHNYNGDSQQYYDYQQQQQQYGVNNNYTAAYPHDGYYSQQAEPMIPISTSNNAGISKMGRNVPDEVDYPRHVPDEIDAPPPPHTK